MPIAMQSLDEYKRSLLELLPDQGNWSENEYLSLTDHTSRLVEYTDGYIEQLPMPTDLHQSIAQFLFCALLAFITPTGGKVHFAPVRLQIRAGKFREPDVMLVKAADDARRRNRFWKGADLTLEVVSKENQERDLVDKRFDYAEGNVPEYWIVNPQNETITVLRLDNGAYAEHGIFGRGEVATSVILPGFSVNVSEVFAIECPPDDPEDEA
jgi:Uma2 family endonuclease